MPKYYGEKDTIVYLSFTFVAFTFSAFVAASLFKYGLASHATRLLFYFHLSLLGEVLADVPMLWNGNADLCTFIAFVRYYSGLANATVVGVLVLYYRHFLLQNNRFAKVFPTTGYRLERLVWGFPLITLIPLLSGRYGSVNDDTWCAFDRDNSVATLYLGFCFFIWVVLIVSISSILLLRTICRMYTSDPTLAQKLASTIGVYALVSLIGWIVRLVAIASYTTLYANIVVPISAIFYFVAFLFEKNALKLFEVFHQENMEHGDRSTTDPPNGSFSWDDPEYFGTRVSSDLGNNKTTLRTSLVMRNPVGANYAKKEKEKNAINRDSVFTEGTSATIEEDEGGPLSFRSSTSDVRMSVGNRKSTGVTGAAAGRDSLGAALGGRGGSAGNPLHEEYDEYNDGEGEFDDSEHDLESVASVLGLEPRDSNFSIRDSAYSASGRDSHSSFASLSSSNSGAVPIIAVPAGTVAFPQTPSWRSTSVGGPGGRPLSTTGASLAAQSLQSLAVNLSAADYSSTATRTSLAKLSPSPTSGGGNNGVQTASSPSFINENTDEENM